jgi:hypothetical protein
VLFRSFPLKKLVLEKKMEDKVFFSKTTYGQTLDDIFEESDIAIGSLGIHRKGLSESSELKTREYCARGIPFICSAFDADFEDNYIYKMKISSDEEPVDIEAVLDFGKKIMSDPEYPRKIRQYACDNLDWQVKIKKLVVYMRYILEESRKNR